MNQKIRLSKSTKNMKLDKNYDLCPNMMNLSRVSNPPKTGFSLSAGLNLEN